MSDEVNAQECAIQLAKVCGRLIKNARQIAEIQVGSDHEAKRRFGSWSSIPIRTETGSECICDSVGLPAFVMSQENVVLDTSQKISGSAGKKFTTGTDFVSFVIRAIAELKATPSELCRLLSEGEKSITDAIPQLHQPSCHQTFGTKQSQTLTHAVLKFSREAAETFECSLANAIHAMREVDVPDDEDVELQIRSEFRFVASTAGRKINSSSPDAEKATIPPKPVPATEATRKSKPRANNIDLVKGILTAHHLRKDDEVNYSPLTNRQIADNSKGAFRHSTARRCLIELFGDVEEYKRQCNDGIVEHFVRAFTDGLRSLRTIDPQKIAKSFNSDGQPTRTGRKSKPVAGED